MTEASATALAEFIDADNIDLKSMRDDFYRKVCKARLQPVLDTITRLKQLGVWIEVTTWSSRGTTTPRPNSPRSPTLSRRQPGHPLARHRLPPHLQDDGPARHPGGHPGQGPGDRPGGRPPLCLRRQHPGEEGENTYCYACKELLIERLGYTIKRYHLKDGGCPKCQAEIDGVWK